MVTWILWINNESRIKSIHSPEIDFNTFGLKGQITSVFCFKLRDNFKKNHTNTGQEPSQIDRKAWRKEQNNLIKNKITEHFEVLFMSKILFVGRSFEVDDLSITKVVRSMKTRVNLACQIVNLQDRAQIEFKIIE